MITKATWTPVIWPAGTIVQEPVVVPMTGWSGPGDS
jgi:hypothetical protein